MFGAWGVDWGAGGGGSWEENVLSPGAEADRSQYNQGGGTVRAHPSNLHLKPMSQAWLCDESERRGACFALTLQGNQQVVYNGEGIGTSEQGT